MRSRRRSITSDLAKLSAALRGNTNATRSAPKAEIKHGGRAKWHGASSLKKRPKCRRQPTDAMGHQETSARDGHVLGHRLDNLDESTRNRGQVGFLSEDDSDWAKPRQFINGQRYHCGSRCGLLDAIS